MWKNILGPENTNFGYSDHQRENHGLQDKTDFVQEHVQFKWFTIGGEVCMIFV